MTNPAGNGGGNLTGTGAAVPAGAGAGGSTIPTGTTGGVPVTGESLGDGQMKAGTLKVSGKRSDAGDPDNPEAEEYIAKGKAARQEKQAKARAEAAATGAERSAEVNKGKQGDVASGGKRKGKVVEGPAVD